MSRLVMLPVRGKGAHYVNPGFVREVFKSRARGSNAACCRVVFSGGVALLVSLPVEQVVAILEGRAGGTSAAQEPPRA